MQDKKIKVLMQLSDNAGVGHYRSIWPAQEIEKTYGDEIFVEINLDTPLSLEDYKKFDIVHFHRQLGPWEKLDELTKELRKHGVITVMDLDDYWSVPTTHPMYAATIKEKMSEKITNAFKLVDYVSTTTNIFAKEIQKFNKNTIIIPNGIDMSHRMWQQIDTKKTDKVRVSWIGGSCFSKDTEVLTSEGFKYFKDLNGNEKIACLNPNNNELEYHKPLGYIKKEFNGKLNCGKNNLIEYEVTPNHNMYVSIADSLTQKKLNLNLVQSEKVHGKNMHFKKDAMWNGEDRKEFILSKLYNYQEKVELEMSMSNVYNYKIATNSLVAIEKYSNNLTLNMDSWLKFFGFWIAEGWASTTPGLFQVGIAQIKNNGYLEEIYQTLIELGFNPTYTKDLCQVRVFDKRLWTYLSQFGKAENKFIPQEILSLCPRQLNIFLDWYLKGDGSQENGGKRFDKRLTKDGQVRGIVSFNSKRKRAYTVSKKLSDNIQEICLKLGIISTITNRGIRSSTMKDGRKVFGRHDAFVISVGENSIRSRKTPLLKKEDQFQIDYNDFVYCVEVPYNIIYVRKNGKTMWCGNSHMSDLDLITSSMNILMNDTSLKDKFQIVMCGYDVRGFMTEVGPNGEYMNTRKIQPSETIWNKFEEIFTNHYNGISPEYKNYLLKYSKEEFKNEDVYLGNYVRRWTLPLTRYGEHYNYCDVCLAPLTETMFNEVKSELKIIEAGLTRKTLIAQDFGIYKELIENGKNGILIPKMDNMRGWYTAIKKVVLDKDYREMLANNLYDFVIDKYTLAAVTKTRVEFYRDIIKKRDEQAKTANLEGATQD